MVAASSWTTVSLAVTCRIEATKIVRYVARGQAVHATSTALSADDVHVRSATSPPREVLIDFKLYFPEAVPAFLAPPLRLPGQPVELLTPEPERRHD
jgi:hypothetical protein